MQQAAAELPMSDRDIANVTELHPSPRQGEGLPARKPDRTNAERSRRFRAKRRTQRTAVPPAAVAAPVAPVAPPKRNGVAVATTMAALAFATVSAGFSITGMTAVFVGSFWPVIAMGVAIELGKLSAVAALPTLRGRALKTAIGILVGILMGLNAIGAYGFLAKAHIGHAVEGDVTSAGQTADIDARLSVQAGIVADFDRRLGQIDGAIEKATSKGRTAAAMALADQQRKVRGELVAQRTGEAKGLAVLQVEKAIADGERRKVEADLGPVRYLATLLGAGDQDALQCRATIMDNFDDWHDERTPLFVASVAAFTGAELPPGLAEEAFATA
jgi:hypothetical protein